jgi:hypothetical protein
MNYVLALGGTLCIALVLGDAWAQPSLTDTEAYRVYAAMLLR